MAAISLFPGRQGGGPLLPERKRQAAPDQIEQRGDKAHRLGGELCHRVGGHRRRGCARSAPAEGAGQQKIQSDIDSTGQSDEIERRPGVPQPPEDSSHRIVADDEGNPAGTDQQILAGVLHRLGGRVQQRHRAVGKQQHKRGEHQRRRREQDAHRSHCPGGAGIIPLPYPLADQHRAAHGQPQNHAGQGLHDLAADGYTGYRRRIGESPHHEQVRRAIQRLQQACQQKRACELQQRNAYPALR